MSKDSKSADIKSEDKSKPRLRSISILLVLCASLICIGFLALGTWQVQRLSWKRNLIARTDQRVHAPPSSIPRFDQWNDISRQSDEFRHVRLTGIFLPQFSTQVQALTIFGPGFWLMTPLQTPDGRIIWVNRGFISSKPASGIDVKSASIEPSPISAAPTEVIGLLRISEPGGAFLRTNHPEQHQWFSRDIAAMTATYNLTHTAPFFIDAEATETSAACSTGLCGNHPVGGLTVIAFNNNHLVYSITWYVLALMAAAACYILVQSELKLHRRAHRTAEPIRHPEEENAEFD